VVLETTVSATVLHHGTATLHGETRATAFDGRTARTGNASTFLGVGTTGVGLLAHCNGLLLACLLEERIILRHTHVHGN